VNRRGRAGDRASFDEIYEKYHIPLFRCAYLIGEELLD